MAAGEAEGEKLTTIGELLEADKDNTKFSQEVLNWFDPWFSKAFDVAANLFNCFMRAFSHEAKDDDDLQSDKDEQSILASLYSRRVRPLLLLQAYRSYMYSATDFRRLRVTTAIGFLRVEIEAVALMLMIRDRSELAVEWYNIGMGREGVQFYKKTSKEIKQFRERLDLETEWNLASAASQHTRLVGMIDGLTRQDYRSDDRYVSDYSLALQDYKQDKPEEYISRGLYILKTQAKLIPAMVESLPEAADPILLEQRIPIFMNGVGQLYRKFENQFPEFIATYRDGS